MLIESPPAWDPRPFPSSNPDWDRMSVSLVRSIAVAVPYAIGAGAERVLDAAYDAWPVATGKSRDALSLTYEVTDRTYTALIDNPVSYAGEIHDGDTVTDLLLDPARAILPSIVAELERLIGGL